MAIPDPIQSSPAVEQVVEPAQQMGSTTSDPEPLDINSASTEDLNRLGGHLGKAIIAGRPSRSIDELVSKRVLKRSTFSQIKGSITAN